MIHALKYKIKNVVRYYSTRPIIGRPLRYIITLLRLTDVRRIAYETDSSVKHLKLQMGDMIQLISELKRQQEELHQHQLELSKASENIILWRQQVEENHLAKMPDLIAYLENLKKSLPVVLREHQRLNNK